MSSSALFGNVAARSASKNLVEFKAGKMTMKGKIVYPDSRKGQLYVYQSDDSLMHFCWKDRTTGVVEDDLIIFPDDCEFKHVSQCKSGRVYLLKFKSSSRKFFFWLQDLKTEKDEEHCRKINEVLNNPPAPGSQRNNGSNPEGDIQNLLSNMSQQQLMQLFGVGQIGSLGNLLGNINRPFTGNRVPSVAAMNPVTTTGTRSPPSLTPSPATPEIQPHKSDGSDASLPIQSDSASLSSNDDTRIRLTDLQSFLSGITPHNLEQTVQRGVPNELSAIISAAFDVNENLEKVTKRHLPPGDNLSTTLSSPQFSQALSLFWSAMESGQAAPVIQQFGLGQDVVKAARNGNILQFISALEVEVKSHAIVSSKSIQEEDQLESQHQETSAVSNPLSKPKKDDDDEGMSLD